LNYYIFASACLYFTLSCFRKITFCHNIFDSIYVF
jgi:hypothetical protein